MQLNEKRWEPNRTDIAARVLDGEAVIIDLARGTYYSMDKVGAAVWELLEAGCTLAELTSAVTARYAVSAEQASQDIAGLTQELLDENLIVEASGSQVRLAPPPGNAVGRLEYVPPKLRVYRDMADLMVFLEPPTPGAAHERLRSLDR